MKTLMLAAAAALLAPGLAAAQDLSGTWNLNLNIADMMIPVTCTFVQAGQALTGSCGGPDGKPAALTGTVDGAKLSWAYDTQFQDMPMHVAYKGDIKSDTAISGALDVPGASGTFTGTK